MSKSLKKLIDINRLREFKNKLVGVGSAYVQTTAVDQTIAGTKTFSKPIVGSVTGSSGSCTGNAATATKATQDSAGQQINTTYIKGLAVSGRTITYTKGDNTTGTITTQDTNTDTKVIQTVTTTNAEYPVLFSADANKTATSTTTARFSSNIKINPSTNTITATTFKGNLTGNVTGNASTATTATTAKSCTGNAATATKATQDSDGKQINTTYSKVGHTHDDRYYTETEVNNLLNGKANTSGTYNSFNAGNGVDSSGNGWIRFKNGIQICTGGSPSIDLRSGEIKITFTTFPKSFKTAPNVITCSANPHVIASTWSISTTGCDIYLKSTSSGDVNNFGRYIAFGTWK